MSAVALLVHHERTEAAEIAAAVVAALRSAAHDVRLPPEDAGVVGAPALAVAEDRLCEGGLDLAVAVGGDGTMLRTVALVAPAGVPVLGVNVGNLGYLTEVEPDEAIAAVERILAGDHGVEERMLLSVQVEGQPPRTALNEAVVGKTANHTVRVAVHLDGDYFTTYEADGLILASPTGSTAYSFSARGPILDPELRAMVLTPVSPHMLFDRSLVLQPDLQVRLVVQGHRPATLSIDGRDVGLLHDGEAVTFTGSPVSARLVTFGPRDFHRILKTKFGLADR